MSDGIICELWWNNYGPEMENDEDYPITLTIYQDTTYHEYVNMNLDYKEELMLGIDEDNRTEYTEWFSPEEMQLWDLTPRMEQFVKLAIERFSK